MIVNDTIYTEMSQIGIILHWGLYSVAAFDDIHSVRRRKIKNGSEWYYKRLHEKGDYRPISGHLETKKYHEKNFSGRNYYDLKVEFDKETRNFNFDSLFQKLVNTKVSYIILTAKHHDGFCLWNTRTTNNKSERDLVGEFFECGHKYGIKVGIYYSWFEFGKSITKDFIHNIILPQIVELRNYKPFYWWFDGHWEIKTKYAKDILSTTATVLHKEALVNSRIIGYDYDITIFGDRLYPTFVPEYKWEYIFTIGYSWGYNKAQEKCDYKDGKHIKRLYEIVSEKKGDFLINFGPTMTGELDKNEYESYTEFIRLIS
jgi:alpha-L-fucosidase